MENASPRRVLHPPPKPVMLFDGDCHFCRRWIERWKDLTGDAVEYRSFQEAGAEFPEIAVADLAAAVHLIDANGEVFRGAEAVFRALAHAPGRRWPLKIYQRVPVFAALAEGIYRFIARRRMMASFATRTLWGTDVRRPTYLAARRGFLRTIGLVYLIAFISIWVQVDGLMGARGLIPAGELLNSMRASFGGSLGTLALQHPTLCWLNSSDAMLHALCLFGVLASALLTFGFLPLPALIFCFASYLSLINAGELFFSYQWDILLLETGFVALFVAPWQWRFCRGHDGRVPVLGLFLIKLLLFKLMFMSGVVKLTSGDASWIDLTALDYHYWTQPLPTIFAWFADKNPEWLKKFSVAAVLFIEIVVPFFIWAPRRLRITATGLLIGLQLAIALTGNYCFFNLLTIALCLPLIDDASWSPRRRERASDAWSWSSFVPAMVLIVTLPVNAWLIYNAIRPEADAPKFVQTLESGLAPFQITNGYGLFRVMTKDRPEIIFEGSADAFDWQAYEFKWKPGDLQRAPQWNAPHQPRLDWSMWFAALGSRRDGVVAERLVERLLQNDAAVLRLLARNPFPEKPPQFIRASLYEYRFSSSEEHARTGEWWTRELRRQYLPTLSLRDFQR